MITVIQIRVVLFCSRICVLYLCGLICALSAILLVLICRPWKLDEGMTDNCLILNTLSYDVSGGWHKEDKWSSDWSPNVCSQDSFHTSTREVSSIAQYGYGLTRVLLFSPLAILYHFFSAVLKKLKFGYDYLD